MRPSSNSRKAFGTEDWLGIVTRRIQRPRTRSWLSALKDCEPPLTCMTASVLPCVGRTAPNAMPFLVDDHFAVFFQAARRRGFSIAASAASTIRATAAGISGLRR